jgi:hypothetical protein
MKLFQKLFAQESKPTVCVMRFDDEEAQAESSEPKTGITDGETLDKIYEEFCTTVCHKPGILLMDQIRKERIQPLIDWLHWKNNNAETMAFLTLTVGATRKGINLWDQTGIKAFHQGGKPPRSSVDALATLAQIMGLRIRLFYEEPPDSDQFQVWEFEP